jgi:N-acetyl-anhydromuramoyl-L-alanine amidase
MNIQDGWITTAKRCASPNCYELDGRNISLLVIHNISLPPGHFGGGFVDQLFTNCLDPNEHPYFQEISHLRVSSHLFIRRNGELNQYVPFDKCAQHAGESNFLGRPKCNDFSIGIELEGTDADPYTNEQYSKLIEVTKVLLSSWPAIKLDNIVGHSDIAPGRKTDPGPSFDWIRFKSALT